MSRRKINIDEKYLEPLNELKSLYIKEKGVGVTQYEAVELAITETLERKKKKSCTKSK